MNQTHSRTSILGTSLFLAALLAGCASTEDVTRAQSTADSALQKANEADTRAKAAQASADQAAQKSDQANAAAAGAQSTANEAKATSDAAKREADKAMQEVNALSEKIDRMFKKTMQK